MWQVFREAREKRERDFPLSPPPLFAPCTPRLSRCSFDLSLRTQATFWGEKNRQPAEISLRSQANMNAEDFYSVHSSGLHHCIKS